MKNLVLLVSCFLYFNAFAAHSVSVVVDGNTYQCGGNQGTFCGCYWYGSGNKYILDLRRISDREVLVNLKREIETEEACNQEMKTHPQCGR